MALPIIRKQIESRILDTGDIMTGALTLSGAPTADLHAATKKYVDDNTPDVASAANKLTVNGGAADRPVYFSNGVPTATTYRMAATNTTATSGMSIANDLLTGIWYVNGTAGVSDFNQSDGVAIVNQYNSSWITEIYQDYRTGQLAIRGKNNGTWQAWRKVLDSTNFNSYALPLTGGTLTGSLILKGAPTQDLEAATKKYVDDNTPSVANAAKKLETARTVITNLSSTATASFDGTANITPGVSGTLALTNGGTGSTTSSGARSNLGLQRAPAYYNIDLTAYATTNFYLIDFGISEDELSCSIRSHGGSSSVAWNQNYIHFLFKDCGWSDSPYSFTMLAQECYSASEITIMSIVTGSQAGIKGVYLRGGLSYTIISNHTPTIRTSQYTYGNEVYGSGTTSITTLTNASTVWTNDGSNKASFSLPLYGAVWNDYAEYRQVEEGIKPGMVVIEDNDGIMKKSTSRLQSGGNIISDTFGFAIGETDKCKIPIAVAGRVLVYPYEDRNSYPLGSAVCSGPNGTVSLMTREEIREYPERILGTVSEIPRYDTWGSGNIKVDNRIWIKVI